MLCVCVCDCHLVSVKPHCTLAAEQTARLAACQVSMNYLDLQRRATVDLEQTTRL